MDPKDIRNLEDALDEADGWLESADSILDHWETQHIAYPGLDQARGRLLSAMAEISRVQEQFKGLFNSQNEV